MLKTVIVDDEQPSLNKLEKLLIDSGLAEVTGRYTNPMDALEFVEKNKVDAVFLDIEMPDMDGIELAGHILDRKSSVAVVFVTAYNQYAVEAFRLNALDYILKPITMDRLMETLCRITEQRTVSMSTEALEARCFGKFRINVGSETIRFRTEKAEELMAFLIDCKGEYVSRSKIIDSLWEDFDGDKAIINFNTTLYYVKKALSSYGSRVSILYDRGSYKLDIGDIDCDYIKFSAFVKKVLGAREGTIRDYEEIASLYQGEYLSGWTYPWAETKRLLLLEQYINLILKIAKLYKDTGGYSKAIEWLKEGLQHEPLHRELNYRLIEALLLTHERVLARRHFEIYNRELMKKTGTGSDYEIRKLFG